MSDGVSALAKQWRVRAKNNLKTADADNCELSRTRAMLYMSLAEELESVLASCDGQIAFGILGRREDGTSYWLQFSDGSFFWTTSRACAETYLRHIERPNCEVRPF